MSPFGICPSHLPIYNVGSKWTYYSEASMARFSEIRASFLNRLANAEERFNVVQYMQ